MTLADPANPRPRLILASASPRRFDLLSGAGLTPDAVEPTHIDEHEIPGELPGPLALRLAQEKAMAHPGAADAFVLAADTVVGVGRRVLPKTEAEAEARHCLALLSGRNHRVFTGIAARAPDEWRGKAGGYAIQGRAGCFVINLIGSFTGVVGLPLYETANLLTGLGYPVTTRIGEGGST